MTASARIGVLGGGQLGRMLALAGLPLGMEFRFLDPDPAAPARLLGEHVVGAYDDPAALERFSRDLDVVTYEFENVPVASARLLSQRTPVLPPPEALEAAQDRLVEKRFLREVGFETAAFAAVDSADDLTRALDEIGLPAVLKTRRMGYDGKGQAVVGSRAEAEAARVQLGGGGLIAEQRVAFDRELSLVGARERDGALALYPLVENRHRDGILRETRAPAPAVPPTPDVAFERCAARLGYVGCLAIELFDVGGRLLANEIAPRVHNTGHWTIEGAVTSQFENHLRAIAGLPLGATAHRAAVMLNIIGQAPALPALLSVPGAHVHLYGKTPRPGRKLGHVTLVADDEGALAPALGRLRDLIR